MDVTSCSDDEWRSVYNRLKTMPVGLYPQSLEYSNNYDPSIGQGDLLEDLADTYRDQAGPLLLDKAGRSNAAFWNWK